MLNFITVAMQWIIKVWSDSGELWLEIDYKTALYSKEQWTLERIEHLIDQVLQQPDLRLQQVELLAKRERTKLLEKFNLTHSDTPKSKLIYQLFEEQAPEALVYLIYTSGSTGKPKGS
ncbi:AMP-binding protein [Paenibacillus sp. SYP-B3998]|uniref:AMP-binding protein n=1 Tax=Paenibacillus sp. SYP-B3998 TaxID=2678564 RepID=A0A6G3ZWY9_9BACL|nr:AMP-binding protein [Paenibacillus sp. SYP-B3998]NEW06736.1 AMP-binding protein [Paenibacillus sp. SYP-B3998]